MIFHYKPSIWGTLIFENPYIYCPFDKNTGAGLVVYDLLSHAISFYFLSCTSCCIRRTSLFHQPTSVNLGHLPNINTWAVLVDRIHNGTHRAWFNPHYTYIPSNHIKLPSYSQIRHANPWQSCCFYIFVIFNWGHPLTLLSPHDGDSQWLNPRFALSRSCLNHTALL